MRIRDLNTSEVLRRFRSGLSWRVGVFSVRLATRDAFVADQLRLLYGEYPLVQEPRLIDAHVASVRSGWPRARFSIFRDGRRAYRRVPRQQVVPLLEWTLNLCVFHQPSIHLLVHAAVVERDGFAAILPGGAGAGKSTLCAALIYRGWRLLSDEVAVIRLSDGQVLPAPRPVSLKEDSIETLQRFAPEAMLGPVWPKTAKGRLAHLIPPTESVLRMDEAAAPAWVVFPSFQPTTSTALNAVPKAQALIECADHAFNYSLHGRQGFETLANLMDACGCYELIYSNLDEGVAELDRLAGRHQGETATANARRG